MSQPKHLRAEDAASARRTGRPSAVRVLVTLAEAAFIACLLEAGTIFGSPLGNVLDVACWSRRRLAVFLVLGLLLIWWFRTRDFEACKERFAAWRASTDTAGPRHLLVTVAVVAGVLAGEYAAALLVGRWSGETVGWRIACVLWAASTCVVVLARNARALLGAPERGFLCVSLAMGAACCALVPVYSASAWDGFIHYSNAQAVSYVVSAEYTGADAMMATYNAYQWSQLIQGEDVHAARHDDAAAETVHAALQEAEDSQSVITCEGTKRLGGGTWVKAATIGNVPNAVGLWVARLFHAGFEVRYFMGRLAGTVFWSLCLYFAGRRLKSGKFIVGTVSLMPSIVIQAAGYTYDPWSVGLIAYAFARFVGVWQTCDHELGTGETLGFLAPFVLGCLVRAVFFPLGLCFLALPKSAFRDERQSRRYRLLPLLAILLLLASFLPNFVSTGGGSGDSRATSAVGPADQVAFVLADPLRYLGVWLRFILDYLSPRRLVDLEPLFFDAPYIYERGHLVADVINFAGLALLILTALFDRSEKDSGYARGLVKLLTLFAVVFSIGLGSTAMYVSFDAVGANDIDGYQVRYLLALLVPLNLLVLDFGWFRRLDLRRRAGENALLGFLPLWVGLVLLTAAVFAALG